jgi:hypothetical protein
MAIDGFFPEFSNFSNFLMFSRSECINFGSNANEMAPQNRIRKLTPTMLVLLLLMLLIQPQLIRAQASKREMPKSYRGLEGAFGIQSFTLRSKLKEIDQVSPMMGGGHIGIVYGTEIVRARLVVFGYYFSTSSIKGSMDLYENSASFQFYPLTLLAQKKTWLQPYLTGGAAYDRLKFYGYHLLDEKNSSRPNYSRATEPFAGQVNQIDGFFGGGVNINLRDHFDFVHLFTEVTNGFGLSTKTRYTDFIETSSKHHISCAFGIRFGAKR